MSRQRAARVGGEVGLFAAWSSWAAGVVEVGARGSVASWLPAHSVSGPTIFSWDM